MNNNENFGTFKIPRQFKNQGTFLKIFKWKSLIYTLVGGIVGFFGYKILALLDCVIAGMVFMTIFAAIGFVLGTLKIPEENFKSGGDDIDVYLYRMFMHIFKKRIYINKSDMEIDE